MGAITDSMFKKEMTHSGSTTNILYPIYGLFFNKEDNQDYDLVYSSGSATQDHAVYATTNNELTPTQVV
jgi:hypothetical protein